MTEIVWAPIPSQQGYEASSLGDIRRSETGKVYSQSVSSEGYLSIAIYADGKRKWRRAHRLVAEAFLGPADGREVNHKNGIKTDNRIENLEWCTKSENIRHRFYVLGKGIKEIVAIAECGCTKSFPSIEEAGRQGFHTGRIYECLNGIAETHKGYRWCRPEDVPPPSLDADDAARIAAIGELIRTQDNRITDSPIFIVQQRRRIYGIEDGYCENFVWIDGDNSYTDEERAVRDAERAENEEAEVEYRQCGYIDIWEFVTACFTEQGCKDYLKRDGHNLREPRIYAAGSYRNEEWRFVRKQLLSIAARAAEGKGS